MSLRPSQHRAIMPLAGIETDTAPTGIPLDQIQGDIYPCFSKSSETFIFFKILENKVDEFREGLGGLLKNEEITTAQQLIKKIREIGQVRDNLRDNPELRRQTRVENPQLNVSFSAAGFKFLGYDPHLVGDDYFPGGMGVQAIQKLGDRHLPNDPNVVDWDEDFKKTIHGVFLVAAESDATLEGRVSVINSTLGGCIDSVAVVQGQERTGANKGHEHFGFLDGISQPALRGLSQTLPGQLECDPGVIIFGHAGDPKLGKRPSWTNNGSLMAFRKLKQLVPEFNQFINAHPAPEETWKPWGVTLSREQQVELTGARLFGRWKSGAPLDITEFFDNSNLGGNKFRNNNFDYTAVDLHEQGNVPGQFRCPFAAHVRKMAPREGTSLRLGRTPKERQQTLERSMIVRSGIPYGDENLTPEEIKQGRTIEDRGLAFVCYQSNLKTGFTFLQQSWANNTEFPPQHNLVVRPDGVQNVPPGFDPIIGAKNGSPREMTGLDAKDLNKSFDMEEWVIARGGEYFFVPSIDTLKAIAEGKKLE